MFWYPLASLQEQCKTHAQPSIEGGEGATSHKDASRCRLRTSIKIEEGIKTTTQELIIASWRTGTQNQYEVYLRKWNHYCKEEGLSNSEPNLCDVLNFLAHLFESGLSYSSINTARSALSTFINVDGKPVGQHRLVIRLMRGVFNRRPNLPKNNVTWDVSKMLNYLKTLSPVQSITLLTLSLKTLALLLLLTGQRGQTLHLMDTRNITLNDQRIKIRFGTASKQPDQDIIKVKSLSRRMRPTVTYVLWVLCRNT